MRGIRTQRPEPNENDRVRLSKEEEAMKNPNKTRKPAPELTALVRTLIDEQGVAGAARMLGVSKLAALNIAIGGDVYNRTLAKVQAAIAAGGP